MEKQALLAASFGTSVPEARVAIEAVEKALQSAAPGRAFYRAFTSPTIRRILKKRGETIPSVEEALEEMLRQGCTDVVLQPTHLLYGFEYDQLRDSVQSFAPRFSRFRFGKPLIADHGSMQALAACLQAKYPAEQGEALVILGHGTAHFANCVYPAMQTVFQLMGRTDILVGTVEGWPGQREVLRELESGAFRRVRFVPLLLVAGEHALRDMAGEGPDSWKSALERAGYPVRCEIEGLGTLADVQELYCAHLRECCGDGV